MVLDRPGHAERDLKDKLFEAPREVDGIDAHVITDIKPSWGEVQYAADPCGNQDVGDFLGGMPRNRDDPELHVVITNDLSDPVHGVDRPATGLRSHQIGIRIKHCNDAEVLARLVVLGLRLVPRLEGRCKDWLPARHPGWVAW